MCDISVYLVITSNAEAGLEIAKKAINLVSFKKIYIKNNDLISNEILDNITGTFRHFEKPELAIHFLEYVVELHGNTTHELMSARARDDTQR